MSKFLRNLYDKRAVEFTSSDGWFILSERAMEEKPFNLEFEVERVVSDVAKNYQIMRAGDVRSTTGLEGFMRVPCPTDYR